MKRWMSALVACVLLCLAAGSAVAGDFLLQNDYEAIVELYRSAVEKQEELGDVKAALDELALLVLYYEEKAGADIGTYEDARLYYAYAKGRLALSAEKPDWAEAMKQLKLCTEDFYHVADYLAYARGMDAMQNERYAEAITSLSSVNLREFTSQRLDAIATCESRYKTWVKEKGKKACEDGAHEEAQGYYSQYLEVLPDDSEVRALLEECLRTHNTQEILEELGLEISRAVSTAPGAMKLSWKGTPEEYTVGWTCDLAGGTAPETRTVTDHSCTVEGLLPGTVYRFTVSHGNGKVEIDAETRKAEDYAPEGSERLWTGSSSLFRFSGSREAFLASGLPSHEFAGGSSCKYLKNRTVALYDDPIDDSCILFVFTTFGVPESMAEAPWQVLLHVEGTGTLTRTGQVGDTGVCIGGSNIYVLLYDVLDEAVERWSDLPGKNFRVDLLVNGLFVASSEGVFE